MHRSVPLVAAGLVLTLTPGLARGSDSAVKACVDAVNDGQVARDEGHLLDARRSFLACASDACPKMMRRDCAKWVTEVTARIPEMRVRALDAAGDDVTDGQLLLDDKPVALDGRSLSADPGPHTLSLVVGQSRVEKRVVLLEAEKDRVIEVRLEPAPAPAPAPEPVVVPPVAEARPERSRTLGWILAGAGAGSVAFGAYVGLLMIERKSAAETGCAGRYCTQEALDLFDEAKTQGTISTVAFGVGAVSLAAGIYLLVRPAATKSGLAIGPRVGRHDAGFQMSTTW